MKNYCDGEKTDLKILRYLYIFSLSEYDKEGSEIPSVYLYVCMNVYMYVPFINA